MTDKKPAIAYLRQSHGRVNEQADNALSLEAQETAIIEWAGRNGYHVEEVVRDHDEVGRSMQRPGLNELRERVRRDSTILVWKYDRFARNLLGQEQVVQELQGRGCEVVSTTEGREKFVRQIFGSVAEYYSDQLSDRLRLAVRTRVSRGHHVGDIPYGLDRSGRLPYLDKHGAQKVRRTGPLTIDPVAAPVIARIFDRWCAGDSIRTIAIALTREQIPSPSNDEWRTQTIAWMLRNPVYAGGVRIKGMIVWTGQHPAIISRETWEQAQVRFSRTARTTHKDRAHWADGLVRHSCGEMMSLNEITRKGGGRYPSYRCNGVTRIGRQRCTDPRQHIGAPLLDRAVRSCLAIDFGDRQDVTSAIETAIAEAGSAATEGERVRLDAAKTELLEQRAAARVSYLKRIDSFEVWEATAREIDAAVQHIDAEIARMPVSPDVAVFAGIADELAGFAGLIADADGPTLRELVTGMGTIMVDGSGVRLRYWPPFSSFLPGHVVDPRA